MTRRRKFDTKKVNRAGKIVRDTDIIVSAEKNKEMRQEERKKLGIEQDVKVRKYVRRKLEEYVEEGKSKEEAVDLMMQEERIVEHFSYWTKNGIDIRQMFISWIKEPENSIEEDEKEFE